MARACGHGTNSTFRLAPAIAPGNTPAQSVWLHGTCVAYVGEQRYSAEFRAEMVRLVRAGRIPEERCPRRTGSDPSGRLRGSTRSPGRSSPVPRQRPSGWGIPRLRRTSRPESRGTAASASSWAGAATSRSMNPHPPRSRVQQDGHGMVTVGVELGRDRGTRESDPVERTGVAVIRPLTPASTPVSPARLPPRLHGR